MKQLAKSRHYGIVQGWIQAPDRPIINMNPACHQAFNKLCYGRYNGRMMTRKNGRRVNLYRFGDGRMYEATKLPSGNWLHEKCGS